MLRFIAKTSAYSSVSLEPAWQPSSCFAAGESHIVYGSSWGLPDNFP
jgi:hypothetical protein